jgi:hypothetical protein
MVSCAAKVAETVYGIAHGREVIEGVRMNLPRTGTARKILSLHVGKDQGRLAFGQVVGDQGFTPKTRTSLKVPLIGKYTLAHLLVESSISIIHQSNNVVE